MFHRHICSLGGIPLIEPTYHFEVVQGEIDAKPYHVRRATWLPEWNVDIITPISQRFKLKPFHDSIMDIH